MVVDVTRHPDFTFSRQRYDLTLTESTQRIFLPGTFESFNDGVSAEGHGSPDYATSGAGLATESGSEELLDQTT